MSSKISALTALTGANVAAADLLPIVDTSATETKKITWTEFLLGSRASPVFTGVSTNADGTEALPSIAFSAAATWGAWRSTTYGIGFSVAGVSGFAVGLSNVYLAKDVILGGLNNTIALGGVVDIGLQRQAEGLWEVNSGIAGQYRDLAARTLKAQLGTSTTVANTISTANVNTTAVGNVGGGTDTLMSYSLPANSLSANGKAVEIEAWGITANNSNPKTVTLDFGATSVLTNALTVSVAGVWYIKATVVRTGAGAQAAIATLNAANNTTTVDVESTTPAADETAAITIKCTGTVTDGGGGINNNDIVQRGLVVKFLN